MASLNKIQLIGHLGKDPEVRYTASGAAVASVSMATSERWKDKRTGEFVEETEWHNLTFFDKLAEIVGEYLHKGSLIYVEGKIKTEKWQDKDGRDRYTTKVMVREMKMLGGKDEKPVRREGGSSAPAPAPAPAQRQERPKTATAFDDMEDDIPF